MLSARAPVSTEAVTRAPFTAFPASSRNSTVIGLFSASPAMPFCAAKKGTAGETLKRPITVEVRDDAGNAVEGARVTASVLAGALVDSIGITDSLGVASFRWKLGSKAGRQQMVVKSGSLPPLTATVQASAGSPANIEFVAPPTGGTAGRRCPGPSGW